jgi:hypothetical protein
MGARNNAIGDPKSRPARWLFVEAGARRHRTSNRRGAAAACYIPLPGLSWVMARLARTDRLVRHHARQAGPLVVATWLLLLGLGGLLDNPRLAGAATAAAGVVLALALGYLVTGAVAAASGRFLRLRPLWDVVNARRLRRTPPS